MKFSKKLINRRPLLYSRYRKRRGGGPEEDVDLTNLDSLPLDTKIFISGRICSDIILDKLVIICFNLKYVDQARSGDRDHKSQKT